MKITVEIGPSTYFFNDEQFNDWPAFARGWNRLDRRLMRLMLEEALGAVIDADAKGNTP